MQERSEVIPPVIAPEVIPPPPMGEGVGVLCIWIFYL